MTPTLALAAVALLAAARETHAQYHEECWYRLKSGYTIKGSPPTSSQIYATMQGLSKTYNVPVEVIASVCWNESNWLQFAPDGYVVHNKTNCRNLYLGYTSVGPPDVGLMQLYAGTARQFNIQQLISDYAYNLQAGVKVLVEKWNAYYKYTICPQWYPGRPTDHDPMILENWYYPLKLYNSWANLSDFSYVEKIYNAMESPHSPASDHVFGVRVTRPWEAIPNFTFPPAAGKYYTWFKAFSGNRIMDGYSNNHYSKLTHTGTYGVTVTSIAPLAFRCTADALNVRSGPGTSYLIKGQITLGMTYVVNAKDSAGIWLRIWFDGTSGWCHASYLAQATGVTGARVTTADLNVRSGAGTGYSILGKVHSPETYIRVGTSGGWHKINWRGGTAWIYAGYTTAVGF